MIIFLRKNSSKLFYSRSYMIQSSLHFHSSNISICITHRMHHFIDLISPALDSIASRYAGSFHSMAFHYEREINDARLIIERETRHIQPKNIIDHWNRVLPIIRLKISKN